MKTQYIANVVEALGKEAKIYLVENENIDVIDDTNWKSNPFDGRISLVNITGKLSIIILLCLEEELFQILFTNCFKTVDESEKEELEDAFPDEILNLIAGLSMRHFPKELDNLTLSVPYKLSSSDIKSKFIDNKYEAKTLSTKYGNIGINILEN